MTFSKDWAEGVSIIVPTFRRPEGLKIALNSLKSQDLDGRAVEIIVVDNDGGASAKEYVTALSKKFPMELLYLHEPEPGVSSARNAAMATARGRYRAFLDDDMEATSSWLSEMLRVSTTHNSSVCFGPIDAKMPDPNDTLNLYMQPFFSRSYDGPEGPTNGVAFGMGGCMLDLTRCDMPVPPFNTDMNEVGGEDDWLFSVLMATGANMTWAPKAMTYEHVPKSRLSLKYFWNRNFAFGQGPTQIEADKGVKGTFGIIKWMAIGLIQTIIYAPTYALLKLVKNPKYIVYHAKLAQGSGKILWWGGFSPRMYGAAISENKEA